METRGNLEKLSEGKVHILTRSATHLVGVYACRLFVLWTRFWYRVIAETLVEQLLPGGPYEIIIAQLAFVGESLALQNLVFGILVWSSHCSQSTRVSSVWSDRSCLRSSSLVVFEQSFIV